MKISYLISKILKKIHIPAIKSSNIHFSSKIGSFSHIVNVTVNRYSYVGSNCSVIDSDIGSFCSIADNVIIGGASHPMDWVSTSPVFHIGKNFLRKNFSKHEYNVTMKTTLKNDIWIGNNSLIKSGVTIENGAIVGMGSVVTKDIGAYEIWAGNPAKFIRKRFNEEEIKVLLHSLWWEYNDNELVKLANVINNKKDFIAYLSILDNEVIDREK